MEDARDRYFSVEEAAAILECCTRTVQRLIADGWLNGPVGRPSEDESARISGKSIFQLMIYDRLSRFPIKVLKEFKNGRKNFARLLRQIEGPKRFSIVEKTGQSAGNSPPDSVQQNNPEKRCVNHDFSAEHQFSFGWKARQLAPEDPALQDDLVQEMSLAVLEYKKPADFEYLFELATNRAIDYLRYEERRGMMSLDVARQQSDSFEEKMESLRQLIDKLTNRGVPVEWIEEVLGERQEVA